MSLLIKMNQSFKILILTLSFIAFSNAETIYKTVDEKGRTTYSSIPAESDDQTTSVEISPAPSDERVEAAQQRHKRNVNAAEIMDENRKQRIEINQQENRIQQERQKQLQQNTQTEDANDTQHYGYPYYPRRPLHKPVVSPPVHRPAHPLR